MTTRGDFIRLAHELEAESNEAFSLWTWLPSYKEAKAAHGDYASNFTPTVTDVLREACVFIAHGLNPTNEQRSEAGELYACPCGETHEAPPTIECPKVIFENPGVAS